MRCAGDTVTLNNCTVSGNTVTNALGGTGGIYASLDTITLKNTIVAKNLQGNNASDIAGTFTAASVNNLIGNGNNLFGQPIFTNGANGNKVGTGAAPLDPKLNALTWNGGLTETMLPLSTSPVLNAGSTSAIPPGVVTDQRGQPRTVSGKVDIGATEGTTSATLIVTNTSDFTTPHAGDGSLRGEIMQAELQTGNVTIGFDPSVFAGSTQTITLGSKGTIVISYTVGVITIQAPSVGVNINAAHNSAVLQINAGTTAQISNLNFLNAKDIFGVGAGIDNSGTLTLSNSLITGNSVNTDGGGIYNLGRLTLTNSSVSGNTGGVNGGGIDNVAGAHAYLSYCTISNNVMGGSGYGAGIRNDGVMTVAGSVISGNSGGRNGGGFTGAGTTTLTNSVISGNSVGGLGANGGGIMISVSPTASANLTNCTVAQNFAPLNGGGIAVAGNNKLTLSNSILADNSAVHNGGGIYVGSGSTATITNSILAANTASGASGSGGSGGAIFVNTTGTANISNSVLSGNSAKTGGGLFSYQGTATVTSSIISNNTAKGDGGGVESFNGPAVVSISNSTISNNTVTNGVGGGIGTGGFPGGTVIVNNTTISGNSASTFGGGIYDNQAATVTNSTLSGNSAGSKGGGFYHNSANGVTATLTNSTLTGNTATNLGGAIYSKHGTTALYDATISGNTASSGGGMYIYHSNTATLNNSLIAGNSATTTKDIAGKVASGSLNNLVGDGSGMTGITNGSGGNQVGTSGSPINPLLSTLGNYGGPTQTLTLLPGSPALDAGSNAAIPSGVTTDQRGDPRIVNGTVDIGAFESSGFTVTITSGGNQGTTVSTAFSAPLAVNVAAVNAGEPIVGGKLTFTAPSSGATATLNPSTPFTLDATGNASVNATANGTAGVYTVTASAGGNNQATFQLNNELATTTTVSPSVSTSIYGTSVTFTAIVLVAGNPVTTGTVTFMDGSTTLASNVPLDSNGHAQYITSNLSATGHTIQAIYSGASGLGGSSNTTSETVSKYAFTYTVGNATQTYGSPVNLGSALGTTISTGINGETLAIIYSSSHDTNMAHVGTYADITGTLANGTGLASNYMVTLNPGSLTVNPAPITYTIQSTSQTYGLPANLGTFATTFNTGINGQTLSISSYASSGDTATAHVQVGGYAITGSVSDGTGLLSDYSVTLNNGTLTVNPATVNFTIGNASQVYGTTTDLAAALPPTISTGTNGEMLNIAYGSTGTTTTSHVGAYPITGVVTDGSGLASDYTVNLTNGVLTVTPASINYTIGNDGQTYGTAANLAGDLPATFNTGVNGQNLSITYASTGDTLTAHVNTYSITGTASDGTGQAADYSVTFTNGILTVGKASIPYTIHNDTQTYGTPANLAGDLPGTFSTGINGQTLSISGYSSSGDTSTAHVQAGGYTITAATIGNGTGLASDYTVTLNSGTLTVNPAPVTYTIQNATQTYGSPASLASFLTSFPGVNGETLSIGTYASLGDTSTAHVQATGYTITGVASDGTGLLSDYNVTLTDGMLTVNPAPISYSIQSVSQTYGSPADLGLFQTSFNTGINGETLSIGSYASPGDTATAHVLPALGTYAITGTISNGTGLLSDYGVTLTNGKLTVSPADISFTIGNDSHVYGSVANLAGDLPGTFATGINSQSLGITYTSNANTATTPVGTYSSPTDNISGTATDNGASLASDYIVSFTNGTMTVTPATLTYVATPTSSLFGDTIPALTGSVMGFVNGEGVGVTTGSLSFTTTAIAGSPVGSYPITGGGLSANNYIFVQASGNSSAFAVAAAGTTTVVGAVAPITFGSADQPITLSATVSSPFSTVGEGTVTFTLFSGINPIGTPMTSPVSSGSTSVMYTVPGNTPSGSYTIKAVYNAGSDYTNSTGMQTLMVNAPGTPASTHIVAASVAPVSFSAADQSIPLSATVTSGLNVNVLEGTVTFTLLNSQNIVIGTPIPVPVSSGSATGNYVLPGGTPGGAYTIQAVYNANADLASDTDSLQTLGVQTAPVILGPFTTVFDTNPPNSLNPLFIIHTTGYPLPTFGTPTGLPSGMRFMPNSDGTATLSGTPAVAPGAYPFNVVAMNGQGQPVTQVFTLIVATPPLITSPASATFLVGKPGSFKVTTTAGIVNPTTLKETGTLPGGVKFSPATGVLSGTPLAGSAGTYTFSITASNATGSDVQTFTLTVDQAPVFKSMASTTFILGQSSSFLVKTIGTLAETFSPNTPIVTPLGTFTLTNNGDGTATLTGTPNATGTTKFTITASNTVFNNTIAGGAVSTSPIVPQLFTLKVINGFTSPNTKTFTVGSSDTFTVTPSVLGTLTAAGVPSFLTFNPTTGVLTGTPPVGAGRKYVMTFTNVSGPIRTTQAFTLLVNEAPAFTGSATAAFTTGVFGTVTIKTTGYPLATLAESGVLPAGLHFKNNGNGTATISGKPAAGTGFDYPLTLTAHNGLGSDATETFTVTVKQPPAFTSPASVGFAQGLPNLFTITTTGFPTPTFIFPATLPDGLVLTNTVNGTATLTGTPTSAGTFTLMLKATNGTTTVAHTLTVKVAPGAAPHIFTGSNADFGELEPGSFTIRTTGFPAATFSWTGLLPTGVSFKDNGNGTATINGKPAAGTANGMAMTYPLTITAQNAVGTGTQTPFMLTVHQPITSSAATTFIVGTPGSFPVTTLGTAKLSEIGVLPRGVIFSAGMLHGTPAAGTGGTYTFTIVATTPTFRSAQTFRLTVQQPPIILTPKIPTFIVGQFNSFTVKTTGFPAPGFTVTGLPGGLSAVDNQNGTVTISGIPWAGMAGTMIPFTIDASNSVADAPTQHLFLTIDEPPVIVTPNSPPITMANRVALTGALPTFMSSGNPGATLSVIGALPPGIVIHRTPGMLTLSGTPSVAGTLPRTFNFVIAASASGMPKAYQTFSIVVS
jgi:hypothetical protein